MDKIVYIDYETKICASALNAISDTVWDALGQAKTPEQARQFLAVIQEAPNDGNLYLRSNLQWVSALTSLQHNDLAGRSTADAHPISAITGLQDALDLGTSNDAAQDALIALKSDKSYVDSADAGLQSQITDNADAIAGLSSPAASAVTFVPSGTIVATNVQNALQELDGDKVSVALPVMSGTLNMGAGAKTNYGGTTGVLQVGGEDALEINQTAKTIAGINGYLMAGNGPAVRVIAGGTTSIPASTVTKVLLDTEEFDTNNNFANSRFTPTVAGYYSVTGQAGWGSTTGGNARCAIYKNGVAVADSAYVALIAAGLTQNVATLVYCNGTTDYIELWAAQTSAGALNVVPTTTNFTACLVRAA